MIRLGLGLVLAASTLLTGCAAPRTIYVAESRPFSRPEISQVATAAPGDAMLHQGTVRTYDAIRLPRPVSLNGMGNFEVPAGVYLKDGESTAAEFFSWDEVTRPTRVGINSNGSTLKHLFLVKSKAEAPLCAETFDKKYFCSSEVAYERMRTNVADTDSFQRTLIYSGRVGNRITLAYREFSGGLARPAFSNNAEYDLSESMVLVYQGAQIEVIEATNQGITYRVIRNFNEAR